MSFGLAPHHRDSAGQARRHGTRLSRSALKGTRHDYLVRLKGMGHYYLVRHSILSRSALKGTRHDYLVRRSKARDTTISFGTQRHATRLSCSALKGTRYYHILLALKGTRYYHILLALKGMGHYYLVRLKGTRHDYLVRHSKAWDMTILFGTQHTQRCGWAAATTRPPPPATRGHEDGCLGRGRRARPRQFADSPSPSRLKHLLKGRGGCSRTAVSPTAIAILLTSPLHPNSNTH